MRLSKFFQRIMGSLPSVRSDDSGCDVAAGLQKFIQCGTANIIEASFIGAELQDTAVTVNGDCHKRTKSSSSSSGDSDTVDVVDGIEHGGVQVTTVTSGSFAHGLGLRQDDVILTVNDKRVASAEVTNFLMERLIDADSRLALEIQRKERGLIRLDNGGDAIEVEEVFNEDEVYCQLNPTTHRLKHIKYRKYLTVENNKIKLSKFSTKTALTHFKIYHYQSYSGLHGVNTYARIQHNDSNKCIAVENDQLVLKDPPAGNTLTIDSGFLFKINYPSPRSASHAVNFEAVTVQDQAIGFLSKRKSATLLDKTEDKVLFDAFLAHS